MQNSLTPFYMTARLCIVDPVSIPSIGRKALAYQLIADGRTWDALNCLLISGEFPEKKSDLLYLSNLYSRALKASDRQLIGYEEFYRIENRIALALISLLDTTENAA